MTNLVTFPAAFLAGIVSILSPCVLPVIPAIMAGSITNRSKPLYIITGLTLTFTLMGGIFTALGIATGLTGTLLRNLFILILLLFGLTLLVPHLKTRYTHLTSQLTTLTPLPINTNTPHGAFLLGTALGIAWIPCIGPILGPVLALAATQQTMIHGTLLLATYSLGTAIPLLTLAYTGKTLTTKHTTLKTKTPLIEKTAGLILTATAIAMILGLDQKLQTLLLPYTPKILF